jgi:ABC-type Fe3+ transport system substrate-binding protein
MRTTTAAPCRSNAFTRKDFLRFAAASSAGLLLAACGGGSAAPASSDSSGKPAASSAAGSTLPSALQSLIAAANKEGQVNYSDINGPELLAAANKKFNERFSTNITINLVPLRATETETRLRQDIAARKITLDVVHQDSALIFTLIDGKVDALEQFDWTGTFGSVLPEIKTLVDRAPEGTRGLAFDYQHLVATLAYNTKLVASADAPHKWEDLEDPKWKGKKLVIDPQGSSSYQHLAKWDTAKVIDFSNKLAAQDPLWINSSPNIAKAIAQGEVLAGIPNLNSYLDLKGQPIALTPTDFYPGIQQLIFAIKGSPNINAARLWAAWMATEGSHLYTEMGHTTERAWPESNSTMSKKIAELGGELAMLDTRDKILQAQQVRNQIVTAYQRLGAK